jgi:hypothetical protein
MAYKDAVGGFIDRPFGDRDEDLGRRHISSRFQAPSSAYGVHPMGSD